MAAGGTHPTPIEKFGHDDDPFAPDADPETRAFRLDHFMEHNKLSRDDLLWLVRRCGFEVETSVDRGDGQFLWLVARPLADT